MIGSLMENFAEVEIKIDDISKQIDRSVLELKVSFETAKPMKPNNWDSMKAAFRPPTRIPANE